MKIYDIRLVHTLVQEGPAKTCGSPQGIVEYMRGAFDEFPEQEQLYVVCLNRKNFAKGRTRITVGTASATLAHPREVFRAAIVGCATAIVCVHNHPSGDPAPSAGDQMVTRQLNEAAKTLDIPLIDHVIIGTPTEDPCGRGYYSFREGGLL